MPVLIRIAFRNLFEHKSKSLIIGIIIALGVLILVIGNSLMDTATLGIEKAFINNYTGHVMITGLSEGAISLFGIQSPGQTETVPILPRYPEIYSFVAEHPAVSSITSQITGYALIKVEEFLEVDSTVVTLLFGIEPDSYRKTFDNLEIIEGEYLRPDQKGILISQSTLERLNEEMGTEIGAGDPILLSSFGGTAFKIREVPITGVFKAKESSEGMDMVSYIDAQTLRALKSMTVSSLSDLPDTEDLFLLQTEDVYSLFEDSFFVEETEFESSSLMEDDLFGMLARETGGPAEPARIDSGAWEYILLRLENPGQTKRFLAELNLFFLTNGIDAKAGNWKAAAGPFATSADVVRIVFNAAVILVAIVAVIIIMNTLVISVIERTPEIGTMRALGAHKGFIRRLFTLEIMTISIVFGLIGIAAALLILGIVTLIGIKAGNPFVELLFAGPVLKPVIDPIRILFIWAMVILIGMVANTYPLRLALKVAPIKAMQTE